MPSGSSLEAKLQNEKHKKSPFTSNLSPLTFQFNTTMINYSLGARLTIPGDKHSEKKVYAYAQSTEVIDIQKLGKHIQQHGSPFTRDIIVAVLTKAVDCIREQLLEGKKVNLGEMGSFYCTLASEGVDSTDDFNPAAHIKRVNVRWDRGHEFDDLLPDAEFHYVTTREEQAAAKKLAKEALDAIVSSTSTGGDDDGDDDDGETE